MADSASVAKIAKPQLRRLLTSSLKKEVLIGTAISAVVVFAYKMAINDPRKEKYAEFYKTYDPKRDYARMKAANIFTADKADGTIDEW